MKMNEDMKKRIITLAKNGKRLDGRNLEEIRKLEIEYDISNMAEGSCKISLGSTQVMVGVKLGLGETYDDTPESGNLIVNAEVTPMAGKEYEAGRPSENEITLARVVDRGVRESHCIDMEKLVIRKGERTWEVFIDAYISNDDGNLIDASGIGAIAALRKAKMPAYDKKEDKIDYEDKKTKSVPLVDEPIPVTIVKVGEYLLPDPTKEEVRASSAAITITLNKDSDIVAMQKDGHDGFTVEELEKCLKMVTRISKEVRQKLK